MKAEDLASYQVVSKKALHVKIQDYDMYTTSAPSSGAWLALALKIFENMKWTAADLKNDAATVFHKIIETFKFSYAPATFLGDPRYTDKVAEVCTHTHSNGMFVVQACV